jgi:hypothetical protein
MHARKARCLGSHVSGTGVTCYGCYRGARILTAALILLRYSCPLRLRLHRRPQDSPALRLECPARCERSAELRQRGGWRCAGPLGTGGREGVEPTTPLSPIFELLHLYRGPFLLHAAPQHAMECPWLGAWANSYVPWSARAFPLAECPAMTQRRPSPSRVLDLRSNYGRVGCLLA